MVRCFLFFSLFLFHKLFHELFGLVVFLIHFLPRYFSQSILRSFFSVKFERHKSFPLDVLAAWWLSAPKVGSTCIQIPVEFIVFDNFAKVMNPSLLASAMGKNAGQTGIFSLGWQPVQGKDNSKFKSIFTTVSTDEITSVVRLCAYSPLSNLIVLKRKRWGWRRWRGISSNIQSKWKDPKKRISLSQFVV